MKKPSVSELLDLLNKPALINWANKQGLLGVDISKERGKWLNAGSSIHKQIELYHTQKIPFDKKEDQLLYNNFIQEKEILEIEKNIETDYFIGRFDCKLKSQNKIYIIDYKKDAKNVYLENKLQLVAYGMAEECDCMAIVSVPKFELLEVKMSDRKPYEEILKSLSVIYYSKKEIDEVTFEDRTG
jgi:hypothetical protein